nr:hypothetical protein Iba_chr14fCG5720 [Ipomoea batatas]
MVLVGLVEQGRHYTRGGGTARRLARRSPLAVAWSTQVMHVATQLCTSPEDTTVIRAGSAHDRQALGPSGFLRPWLGWCAMLALHHRLGGSGRVWVRHASGCGTHGW